MGAEAMASEVDELESRLGRYPADRYPAQHATAQFHLGSALLHAGATARALEALTTAERLFADVGMRSEHAKSVMMHGAALRDAGRYGEAMRRFAVAAEVFRELEQTAEEAAAHHNRGLVLTATDDLAEAAKAFTTAQELFRAAGQPVWEAAAARERGTVLLHRGEPGAAVAVLEDAIEQSGEADPAGTGAAANVLGLARLAAGDPAAAVQAFQLALAWQPRSVRPAEHAMVKANLALAHEAGGAAAHARVTARHALGIPEAADPVRALAREVLDRLRSGTGADLFTVLDQEPAERWEIWVRDELLRWAAADPRSRTREAAAWVHEQVARGAEGVEHAQVLLGVLLELPPPAYDVVVRALVQATAAADPAEAERFQAVTGSAMARYPLPQWQRMAASFTTAAERAGADQQWR
jgi:tetratricopeptide (TPR) repeat protein